MAAAQFDFGDVFDEVHQLIDRHQFAAPQVERFQDVTGEDGLRSLKAVIDVHETAGLMAVAPDFNFMLSRELGLDDFPADCGRRLFPPAIVSAIRPINIMETGDAGLNPKILTKMAAHSFAE